MSEPSRTHWAFRFGQHAWEQGQPNEPPFLEGTVAAASWRAGWEDAEDYARHADCAAEIEFDRNYCPPE
jgi:hypothetical protein